MYDGGRRGLPMYDFRCTMYDLGSSRALRGFFLMRIDDNTGKQEFFSADELLSNAFVLRPFALSFSRERRLALGVSEIASRITAEPVSIDNGSSGAVAAAA